MITLPSAKATYNLGRKLGETLPPLSVILLLGDLGAGKTTLVQGIGEGLGIQDPIVSPTFTLVNEYYDGRLPLYHFDLYRLQPEETYSLYLPLYWEGVEFTPGITVIEWAERLQSKPTNYLEILLSHCPEGRQAHVKMMGLNYYFNDCLIDYD